jgi:hypothetical protein
LKVEGIEGNWPTIPKRAVELEGGCTLTFAADLLDKIHTKTGRDEPRSWETGPLNLAGGITVEMSSYDDGFPSFEFEVNRPIRPPTRLRTPRRGPIRRLDRSSARPRERRAVRRTARTTSGSRDGPSSSSGDEPHDQLATRPRRGISGWSA